MPSKEEKERRKKIQQDLSQKANDEFERSLPINREQFQALFKHLTLELSEQECNNTLQLTLAFLQNRGIENIGDVKIWLAEHGGYCDCEVLANVEEDFNG